MNNRFFFKTILLLLFIFTVSKSTEIVEERPNSNLLDDKLNYKNKNKLIVDSKKNFSSNESLKFSIDTGAEEGFIYLVYIDKTGGTSLLYPNSTDEQQKKGGNLNFPEDFGGRDIRTSKDCKDCNKEKTTIVVLLSNDPIENIQNMNEEELIALNAPKTHNSRDFLIKKTKSHILIHKFDFFVE